MRVLVCDSVSATALAKMRQAGLDVDEKTGMAPEELLAVVGDYDAMVVRSATKVKKDVIQAAKNLKVVVRGGVGVDNIDVEAAKAAGVEVKNTPAASSASVAELAIGLMFACARQIPQATASTKEHKWEKKRFSGTELLGKTLGIIGIGRIGREVAKRAHALGMTVLAFDAFITKVNDPNIKMVSMDELVSNADYITLHIPASKDGAILGEKQFGMMKKGVTIINAARGGVVCEKALLAALENGTVKAAALDVFEKEPTENWPLIDHPNVILTPHIGAATKEAQDRIGEELADILIAWSRK